MKLSIVIPVYNVEKFLPACLNSVLNPKLDDYEVIVVNDGSTDSCPAILNDFSRRYPGLMQVINTENGGVGAARNTGIKAAVGKYIAFIDSDDTYASGAVERMLDICNEDFDICFFDADARNENGKTIGKVIGTDRTGEFTLADNPSIVYVQPSTWNKIYRRSLFTDNDIKFPGRVWFEDLRTIPKLYIHAKKMIYVPECLYYYMQRTGSIMNDNVKTERNLEMIDACEDLLSYYRERGLYSEELEYCIFYNELLTSVDRVNLIDKKSDVQEKLINWFEETFPEFKEKNSYYKKMPAKYKLLSALIFGRKFAMLHEILKLNEAVKD